VSTRRARRIEPGRWGKAIPYGLQGLVVGAGGGLIITMVAGGLSGGEFWWWIIPVFSGIVGAVEYVYGALIIEGAGDLVARLFIGRLVETRTDYSYPESLVARGRYEDAVTAYEEAAAENPDDPEPLMRMARVLRDRLRRPEDAVAAFKRARMVEGAKPGQVQLATREIVETMEATDEPLRAIPELARLAEQAAGTKTGEWAARRLKALKQELSWTIKDQARDGRETGEEG